jgi:hypothetical protein
MDKDSSDPLQPASLKPDRDSLSHKVASEAGALVAEQVRHTMVAVERSAKELRQRALDQASADREATHETAKEVLARIDQIEGKLGQLLRDLRADATQIAEEADPARELRPRDAPHAADLAPRAEPIPEAVTAAEPVSGHVAQPPDEAVTAAEPVSGHVAQPPDEAVSSAGGNLDQSEEMGHAARRALDQADEARPSSKTASPAESAGGQAEQTTDDAWHGAGSVAGQPDEAWPVPDPRSPPQPVDGNADQPANTAPEGRPAAEEAGSEATSAAGPADEAKRMDWPSPEEDASTSSADEEALEGAAERRRGGLFRRRHGE